MIPIGYMAKRPEHDSGWLKVAHIRDIGSVSGCIAANFCDYLGFWRHNGYWLFNSVDDIAELATENEIDLAGTQFFYYEAYEQEYDEDAKEWRPFAREEDFVTEVVRPVQPALQGYDVVTYSGGNMPECSPLSCNHLAASVEVNEHCLLGSCEKAVSLLESGAFCNCEPGPFRVIAVYALPVPQH